MDINWNAKMISKSLIAIKIILLFYSFLIIEQTFAYPEMVRHGYLSCNGCHSSTGGGDYLSDYGRSIHEELISAQQVFVNFQKNENRDSDIDNESKLAGIFIGELRFQYGFKARLLQSFLENSQISKARFMIMQLQGDALLSYSDKIDLFYSLGRQEPKIPDATFKDYIYTPQAWIQYKNQITEEFGFSIRSGKYIPNYGVNFAEHVFLVRSALGFGPGQESNNLELSGQYLNEEINLSFVNQKEKKYFISKYSHSFIDNNLKIGINTKTTSDQKDYSVLGVFLIKGFENHKYLIFEIDKRQNFDHKNGLIETLKYGQEISRGLQYFLIQEYANFNIEITDPHQESLGIGLHYFPSTLFNFESIIKKEKKSEVSNEFQNILWIIGTMSI